jgi:hypothetical protein
MRCVSRNENSSDSRRNRAGVRYLGARFLRWEAPHPPLRGTFSRWEKGLVAVVWVVL